MSIFSDHENGYMDDYEYREECKRMNRQDRYERENLDDFPQGICNSDKNESQNEWILENLKRRKESEE